MFRLLLGFDSHLIGATMSGIKESKEVRDLNLNSLSMDSRATGRDRGGVKEGTTTKPVKAVTKPNMNKKILSARVDGGYSPVKEAIDAMFTNASNLFQAASEGRPLPPRSSRTGRRPSQYATETLLQDTAEVVVHASDHDPEAARTTVKRCWPPLHDRVDDQRRQRN